MIILDLETTGTNPLKHSIIDFAAMDFDNPDYIFHMPVKLKPNSEVQEFIDESFVEGEYNMEHNYIKQPSKKNCRWCEFNQTVHCDVGVK